MKNREEVNARRRAKYAADPETRQRRRAQWADADPETRQRINARRRARYAADPETRQRINARHRDYRLKHLDTVKASERVGYYRKQRYVSESELERLRRPENRVEASDGYAGSETEVVCLNCGLVCNALHRHVRHCPTEPEPAPVYKERWGLDRGNPLASRRWIESNSRSRRASKKLLEAQRANLALGKAAFKVYQNRISEAKAAGRSIRRGSLRLETLIRRTGRRLPERPKRQKVSTEKIVEILALHLPLREAAERMGLSVSGLYPRARRLRLDTGFNLRTRKWLIAYCSALRKYVRSAESHVSVKQIIEWHLDQLRRETGTLFHEVAVFLPSIRAELEADPQCIEELTASAPQKGAAMRAVAGLANRFLRRILADRDRGSERRRKDPGRPVKKERLFTEAKKVRDSERLSWTKIAQRLDPRAFAESPRKAGEAIRRGVERLSRKARSTMQT